MDKKRIIAALTDFMTANNAVNRALADISKALQEDSDVVSEEEAQRILSVIRKENETITSTPATKETTKKTTKK